MTRIGWEILKALFYVGLGFAGGRWAKAQSPQSELSAAVADAKPTYRYLSTYAVPKEDRQQLVAVTGYAVNLLSRSRVIVKPFPVSETVLRIDAVSCTGSREELRDWLKAWDSLAKLDPYWHLTTRVKTDGKPAAPKTVNGQVVAVPATDAKIETQTVDGGWVGLENAKKLAAVTGSNGALLRADWFVANALQPPYYYEFTGVPDTAAAWYKSLGIDEPTARALRSQVGANLLRSNITFKPRRIIWMQGPLGGLYLTQDVETVDAERDPLRRPVSANGVTFKHDAEEHLAVQPNGLLRAALYSAEGKRQDSVPEKIAKDTSDALSDGRVVGMLSCARCHQEGGLRPFQDDQSKLFAMVRVSSLDPSVIQAIADFYVEAKLQRQLSFDRETVTASMKESSGLDPKELSEALGTVVREHAYEQLSLDRAAREVGVDANGYRDALKASDDPILLTLASGRAVLRGQWESSFQPAALLAANVKPDAAPEPPKPAKPKPIVEAGG